MLNRRENDENLLLKAQTSKTIYHSLKKKLFLSSIKDHLGTNTKGFGDRLKKHSTFLTV